MSMNRTGVDFSSLHSGLSQHHVHLANAKGFERAHFSFKKQREFLHFNCVAVSAITPFTEASEKYVNILPCFANKMVSGPQKPGL